MNIQQAIEALMSSMNKAQPLNNGMFGWAGGTGSNINVLQNDMNRALQLWREKADASGLKQMAATLQVMGGLDDADYEQIMEAVDSKGRQDKE